MKSFLFSLPYRRPRKERGGDLRRFLLCLNTPSISLSVWFNLFARSFFSKKTETRPIHGGAVAMLVLCKP